MARQTFQPTIRPTTCGLSLSSKIIACFVALALAVGMCPLPSYADQGDSLQAGSSSALNLSDDGQEAYDNALTEDISELSATFSTQATGYSTMPMYRMYNKWSGEHLFTGDASELNKNVKLGWKNEGIAWHAPLSSSAPVYRLYNKWSGDHHFTTDKNEYNKCKKAGWTGEGVGFYSGGNKPVYRLYNKYVTSFYHHYTMDAAENKKCIKQGWKSEGTGWWGYGEAQSSAASQPSNTPVSLPESPITEDNMFAMTEGQVLIEPVEDPTPDPDPDTEVAVPAPDSITYRIIYSANGGTGTVDPQSADSTKDVTLQDGSALSRPGYTFTGWNTEPDGSGTTYEAGQVVCDVQDVQGGVFDLYAKWQGNTYTITFDHANYSNCPIWHGDLPDPISFTVPESVTMPSANLTFDRKTWYSSVNFLDEDDASTYIANRHCEITYYYAPSYGWSLYSDSGNRLESFNYGDVYSGTDPAHYQDVTVISQSELTTTYAPLVLPSPSNVASSHSNEVFEGWYTKKNGGGERVGGAGTEVPMSESTLSKWSRNNGLYAHWVQKSQESTTPDPDPQPAEVTYKVKHYQQKVGADATQVESNYNLAATEELVATAGEQVNPAVLSYEGFTSPAVQTTVVAVDGSTVINYYYTRNFYPLTLQKDANVSSVTGAGSYQYGATVNISATMDSGYKFDKWTGDYVSGVNAYEFTMPASAVTLKATATVDHSVCTAATIDEGFYTITSALNNSLYIDMSASSLVDGGNAQLYSRTTESGDQARAQIWRITSAPGAAGYYFISNARSAKCLRSQGGKNTAGTSVKQYEFSNTAKDLWKPYIKPDGTYVFVSKLDTSKALEVASTSPANNTDVRIGSRTNYPEQCFNLVKCENYAKMPEPTTLKEGLSFFTATMATNYRLSIDKSSSNVRINTKSGKSNEAWIVSKVGTAYSLINYYSANALDVTSAGTSDGVNVQHVKYNGTNAQLWKPYPSIWGGIVLVCVNSGKVLDVAGANFANNTNVHQYSANFTKAQAWKQGTAPSKQQRQSVTIANGLYKIKTDIGAKYLIIADQNTANGANARINHSVDYNSQKWKISKVGTETTDGTYTFKGEVYYKIINANSGRALDLDAGKTNNVQQWSFGNNNNHQLWVARKSLEGNIVFVNRGTGLALDVSGGLDQEGRNVLGYAQNDTKAQSWTLESTTLYVPPASSTPTYTEAGMTDAEYKKAREIFDALNTYRNDVGLRTPLVWNSEYCKWARLSAQYNALVSMRQSPATLKHRFNQGFYLGLTWPVPQTQASRNLTGGMDGIADILQYATWDITAHDSIARWNASISHRKMMQCTTAKQAAVGVINANGVWAIAIVYDFSGINQNTGAINYCRWPVGSA